MSEAMTHPVDIQFFDPHAASPALWSRYHHYRRLRAEEDLPGEPVLSDADFERLLQKRWPLAQGLRYMALRGDQVVGNLYLEVRREGSPDYTRHAPFIGYGGGVLRPFRRQGIATALLRTLHDYMRAHGKHTATGVAQLPEAHAFLAAAGAAEKHRSAENRMPIQGLDWVEMARWQAHAQSVPALRWEIHTGRVPMDRLATLMTPLTDLASDMPLDQLDVPPLQFTLTGHTSWYEELDRIGGDHLMVLLVDHDGQVAAVCNAHWEVRFPDRVYQALTAVARPWRGRGLAKAVKAAMLLLAHERHPDAQMVVTFNADANAPMLSINQRLGFKVHRRSGHYQIDPAGLQVFLERRGR